MLVLVLVNPGARLVDPGARFNRSWCSFCARQLCFFLALLLPIPNQIHFFTSIFLGKGKCCPSFRGRVLGFRVFDCGP